MFCHPLANDAAVAACTDGDEGCTTEYGVATDTRCILLYASDRPACLERCAVGETECDASHPYCRPLLVEEGGFCSME